MVAVAKPLTQTFDVRQYGAVGDGTTDNTAAVQAAINAAIAAGGGCVFVPTGVFRCDSQLSIPTVAGGYWGSKSAPVRITGAVGANNNNESPSDTNLVSSQGSTLDLRYSGSGAKLVALGTGVLQLDHLTLTDLGTSSTPFVLCTLAQPRFRDVVFAGNPSKSGTSCDQDAILLGGTGDTRLPDDITSGFSGYGGYVDNCAFVRIRRAVYFRAHCNGVMVTRNWVDTTCGSNDTYGAPFEIDPGSGGARIAWSNIIRDNTIELYGYKYGVLMANSSRNNVIAGNGFWDPGAATLGAVKLDPDTCRDNRIILDGYVHSSYRIVTGAGGSYGGSGYNWVDTSTAQFCSWTDEYKPVTWKLHLKGEISDYHYITYDATPDGPLLSGYGGVGIRSGGADKKISIRVGAGSPEGVVTGTVGDLYLNTTGSTSTTLYVKTSGTGNTGWTAK